MGESNSAEQESVPSLRARAKSRRRARNAKPKPPPPAPLPNPLDRGALRVATNVKLIELDEAKSAGKRVTGAILSIELLQSRLNERYLMRVWNLYGRRRGQLLAAGNAYLMFFAVGSMLIAGFSIFGIFAADNPTLRQAVVDLVAQTTPGLINTGEGGLATPDQLFRSRGFGIALLISLVTMLVASMSWINGLREAIRAVMGISRDHTDPIISGLRDASTLLLLGVTLVLTSGLGVLSTAAVGTISDWLGWGSFLSGLAARSGSVVLMFFLDVAMALVMFSIVARVRMPRRVLIVAAVVSGAGATILRFFSASFLHGVTNNPVLAPFAVILGLFVWFYLLGQVYLGAAAVAAVSASDRNPHHRGIFAK